MFTGPCDLLSSHLLLLLPYIITKGPSSGKGRSSFSEACQGLVTIAKDNEELLTELASKRDQLTEQVKHANPRLAPDKLLNEVNSLISPVLVCWGKHNPPSVFESFSILIPNGKGGIVKHHYPVEKKFSLPEIVIRFIRILYGYNLNYPSSARYAWQFIERRLVDLYRFEEAPPIPLGAYQTNVAEIEKAISEFDSQIETADSDNEPEVTDEKAGGVVELDSSDSEEKSERAPPSSPLTEKSSGSGDSSPEPLKRTRGRPPARSPNKTFQGKGPRK